MKPKVGVGEDVAALCSKCGESWHVVVAAVGSKIAKVECKQCRGVHRYKDPSPPAKKARAASSAARKSAKGPAGKPLVEANPNRPVRDYEITGSFEPGDRILHKIFGEGVVQALPGPGKVEILFGAER